MVRSATCRHRDRRCYHAKRRLEICTIALITRRRNIPFRYRDPLMGSRSPCGTDHTSTLKPEWSIPSTTPPIWNPHSDDSVADRADPSPPHPHICENINRPRGHFYRPFRDWSPIPLTLLITRMAHDHYKHLQCQMLVNNTRTSRRHSVVLRICSSACCSVPARDMRQNRERARDDHTKFARPF